MFVNTFTLHNNTYNTQQNNIIKNYNKKLFEHFYWYTESECIRELTEIIANI